MAGAAQSSGSVGRFKTQGQDFHFGEAMGARPGTAVGQCPWNLGQWPRSLGQKAEMTSRAQPGLMSCTGTSTAKTLVWL